MCQVSPRFGLLLLSTSSSLSMFSSFSSLTFSKDLEFGDTHCVVASSEKRLVRVTTNTNKNSGITYINIELFKKKEDKDEYRLQQRVGLTVKEFQEIIANVENINMGPPNP